MTSRNAHFGQDKKLLTRRFQCIPWTSLHRSFLCFCEFPDTFTSFYMMHITFCMHKNLYAAGNFYKTFPCNRKSECGRHISRFTEFSEQQVNFPCTFPNITCNQNFVIVIIYSFHGFSIVPPEKFHATYVSH